MADDCDCDVPCDQHVLSCDIAAPSNWRATIDGTDVHFHWNHLSRKWEMIPSEHVTAERVEILRQAAQMQPEFFADFSLDMPPGMLEQKAKER